MNKCYKNEIDFINHINNKEYRQLNILVQDMIKALFPTIKTHDVIRAYKYGKFAKADIINVNDISKGISIKCGSKNSVHLEPIEKFINYLQTKNFNETDKLLRYLYSDGTNNNTGNKRESSEQYKIKNCEDIKILNAELEKIKKDLIIRFLIKTDINYKVNVDLFAIGSVNDFIWATKEEVISYLYKNNLNSNSVHVSNLFIQNWDKNLNYNPKYEHCRNYIQIKWYSMFDDIINIMQNKSQNKF